MEFFSSYKCPCCGGKVTKTAETQPKCSACGRTFSPEASAALENEKALRQEESEPSVPVSEAWEGREFDESEIQGCRCRDCGGMVYLKKGAEKPLCPRCGGETARTLSSDGVPCPDYVMPFLLDKAAAKAKYTHLISEKAFLPDTFLREEHPDGFRAIYVPCWLYEAEVSAKMYFRGHTSQTVSVFDGRAKDRLDYYSLYRKGKMNFYRVPVLAVGDLPEEIREVLEPVEAEGLEPFRLSHLQTVSVMKPTETAAKTVKKAKGKIRERVKDVFRGMTHPYYETESKAEQIRTDRFRARQILCPVWVLHTVSEEKQYLLAVNGRTGKYMGTFPTDEGKKKTYFRKRLLLVSGLAVAAMLLLWGIASEIFSPGMIFDLRSAIFLVLFVAAGLGIGFLTAYTATARQSRKMEEPVLRKGADTPIKGSLETEESKDVLLYSEEREREYQYREDYDSTYTEHYRSRGGYRTEYTRGYSHYRSSGSHSSRGSSGSSSRSSFGSGSRSVGSSGISGGHSHGGHGGKF